MGFLPIDTAINNHVKLSCLIGIYLESWFSWLEGGVQKTLRKKEESRQNKTIENEEREKRRIQEKPNNNNKHL